MSSYTFRKDAFNKAYSYTIEDDGLAWSSVNGSGKIDYKKLAKTRLIYSPNRYQKNTYVLELIDKYGGKTIIRNTNYESLGNFKEQNKSFNEFVAELHKKLAVANPDVVFSSGTTPALYLVYWIIMVFSTLVILGVFYFIITIGIVWIAIAHLVFILYMFPTFIRFLKKNKPGTYDPHQIPQSMLPV